MNKLKKDLILLSGILLTAFLLWMVPSFFNREEPARVRIYQDGKQTADYPLGENLVTSISFEEEHYNLILIEDGKVSVADADCPDQLCVRQRSSSGNGESIICLPHRLVVQIESEEERKLDAIAY